MFAEILVGVALGRKGVSSTIAMTDNNTRVLVRLTYLQLKELTLSRTLDELTFELVAGANLAGCNIIEVWH